MVIIKKTNTNNRNFFIYVKIDIKNDKFNNKHGLHFKINTRLRTKTKCRHLFLIKV